MFRFGISFLLFASLSYGAAVRFDFKDPFSRNVLTAESNGLLERTVVIFPAVAGWMEVDPQAVRQGIKGEVEWNLRRMESGTALKDDFIREKVLAVGEFPTAGLTVASLAGKPPAKLTDATPTRARLLVNLKVKATTKTVEVPVTLTYYKESETTKGRMPGNLLKVEGELVIDPAQLGLTLADTHKSRFGKSLRLAVELLGTDRLPLDPEPK